MWFKKKKKLLFLKAKLWLKILIVGSNVFLNRTSYKLMFDLKITVNLLLFKD